MKLELGRLGIILIELDISSTNNCASGVISIICVALKPVEKLDTSFMFGPSYL